MLDYRDIVDYVLYVFKKKKLTPIPEDQVWGISEIIEKAQSGEPANAHFVADLSNKNPFYSVYMDSTLVDVAEIFGQSNGVHRVNIVDENGKVQGIISQSDLGRYLLSRKADLKNVFDKSVQIGHILFINFLSCKALELLTAQLSTFLPRALF